MQLYQLALIVGVLALALAFIVVLVWREMRRGKSAPTAPAKEKAPRFQLKRPQAAAPAPEEPADGPAPERRRKLVPASLADEAEVAPPPAAAETSRRTFSEEVFDKLEQAFDLYQRQSISLEAYSAMIIAEQQAVERKIGELRARPDIIADPDSAELKDAESAREAVNWCIDWVYQQTRGGSTEPTEEA